MEKINGEEKLLLFLVAALVVSFFIFIIEFEHKTDDTFNIPYSVKAKNDHELQLINKKDTIRLYLENAYGVEEEIIFVRKR